MLIMITKLSGRFSDGLAICSHLPKGFHEHFETVDRWVVLAAPWHWPAALPTPLPGNKVPAKPPFTAWAVRQGCSIVGALTHGGKGAQFRATCGAIGAGVGGYMDYQAKKLRESLANTDVKVEQQGNQIQAGDA